MKNTTNNSEYKWQYEVIYNKNRKRHQSPIEMLNIIKKGIYALIKIFTIY